jgi:hypothetical protein
MEYFISHKIFKYFHVSLIPTHVVRPIKLKFIDFPYFINSDLDILRNIHNSR